MLPMTKATGRWRLASATPVIREGDQVPGMAEGVKLDGGESGSFANSLSINSAGELACIARMSGPGIDDTNDVAILAGESTPTEIGCPRRSARPWDAGWRCF